MKKEERSIMTGKFITLEGPEGSGKIRKIQKWMHVQKLYYTQQQEDNIL